MSKPDKHDYKPSWEWRVVEDKAIVMLSQILSFMREPKKVRRARILVEEYKVVVPRNGKYNAASLARREEFERRFFETPIVDGTELLKGRSPDSGAIPDISTTCGDETGSTSIGRSVVCSA